MSSFVDNPPELNGHFHVTRKTVTSIAFNPTKENRFAVGSDDGSVSIFDIPHNKGSRILKFDKKQLNEIYDIDWSRKNMIGAVGKEKLACIFECKFTNGFQDQFVAHQKTIRSIQFSETGNRVITASDDKSIKMWRLSQRNFISSYTGHTNWVRCARFSPSSNKMIASCAEDKTVRIFDTNTSELICEFKDTKGYGNQLAWHMNEEMIAIAQENARVKVYDLKARKLIQYYRLFNAGVTSLDFHESGNFMITGCRDGTVNILDLLEGREIYTLTGHQGGVAAVKFSRNGEHFVTGSEDHHIMIWKSNLVSRANFDDNDEAEVTGDIKVFKTEKENINENHRKTILIDARKSTIYNSTLSAD